MEFLLRIQAQKCVLRTLTHAYCHNIYVCVFNSCGKLVVMRGASNHLFVIVWLLCLLIVFEKRGKNTNCCIYSTIYFNKILVCGWQTCQNVCLCQHILFFFLLPIKLHTHLLSFVRFFCLFFFYFIHLCSDAATATLQPSSKFLM